MILGKHNDIEVDPLNMKNNLPLVVGEIVLLVVTIIIPFAFGAYFYLSLPVVGIDQNGQCRWVEQGSIERKECPKVLPSKYVKQNVWSEN